MEIEVPAIIACNPPGFPRTQIARAAIDAGYVGALSLEHCATGESEPAIQSFSRLTPFTLFIAADADWKRLALLGISHGLQRIVLVDAPATELKTHIQWIRDQQLEAFAEVRSRADAELAIGCGAEGIVLKGHEAGGRVDDETAFILLQQTSRISAVPIWIRGGIGLHTAAACALSGVSGLVLDWQLSLADESELPRDVRNTLAAMDGAESKVIGQNFGRAYRIFAPPNHTVLRRLLALETEIDSQTKIDERELQFWDTSIQEALLDKDGSARVLALGQDISAASLLASKFSSVSQICREMRCEMSRAIDVARSHLSERSPWAEEHGTTVAVAQGPMTRVSDTAHFANEVAKAGGLPFVALAVLQEPECERLLTETNSLLGPRPWGVGVLGFISKELLDRQLAQVVKIRPRFALIAGGRPSQAQALEAYGISTYLHVPSPILLRQFISSGSRRFVFEGRECGGHVGPRSSFALWESVVSVLLAEIDASKVNPTELHVLFAGGIHDAVSAAMVAVIAVRLRERGVRVGILMGTAYLFTEEAVRAEACISGFQEVAVKCRETVLLESGVGHLTRVASTPFVNEFRTRRRQLLSEGKGGSSLLDSLERFNLGRLRIASKGLVRAAESPHVMPANPERSSESRSHHLRRADSQEQQAHGLYMMGQVAVLRKDVVSIERLHSQVTVDAEQFLSNVSPRTLPLDTRTSRSSVRSTDSDVAIVGMGAIMPAAPSLERFWENILNRVVAIREVPSEHWDWRPYFSSQRGTSHKFNSRWGGFIDDVVFDPTKYGMPPNSVRSIEPLQLLFLEAVNSALRDYGFPRRALPREMTSVILAASGPDAGNGYSTRSLLPHFMREAGKHQGEIDRLMADLESVLPKWTEDSFPGLLANVAAGRVANRFDLRGTNFTVDAACASSLAALKLGVDELLLGRSDAVIVGGADTATSPMSFFCFNETHALSPTGECRPLDRSANGTVISEGVAAIVIKRLKDAERDGDRIYAVVKGLGSSSDGKQKGLTAPSAEGQALALERAYRQNDISPASVSLIEGHLTGTSVGDAAELQSLSQLMQSAGVPEQSVAIGSIKSMIGHTKATAGLAGIIKASLALHHRILPPTVGITSPNSILKNSPLYANTETRPWFSGRCRRAGVNAFGFGGTNFHAILEEYRDGESSSAGIRSWPSELFLWSTVDKHALHKNLEKLKSFLAGGSNVTFTSLAATICAEFDRVTESSHECTLAIVASDIQSLNRRLDDVLNQLRRGTEFNFPGVHFSDKRKPAKVAFVFPGQGSQRPNMLRDFILHFPGSYNHFEIANKLGSTRDGKALTDFIFPNPSFDETAKSKHEKLLAETDIAQLALGAADITVFSFLERLGVRASAMCGHSYGELAALCAAGAITYESLVSLSAARGKICRDVSIASPGAMVAASASAETTGLILSERADVYLSNFNSPSQTIVSGSNQAIEAAIKAFQANKIAAKKISVPAAFHSPLMKDAERQFRKKLDEAVFADFRVPVYSNVTGLPHDACPEELRKRLSEHLAKPVRFAECIRKMLSEDFNVFVEVGPGSVLSSFISDIAGGTKVTSVSFDRKNVNGVESFLNALAQLAVAGVRLQSSQLFVDRAAPLIHGLEEEAREPAKRETASWTVNSRRSTPMTKLPAASLRIRPVETARASSSDVDTHPLNHAEKETQSRPALELDALLLSHQQMMERFLDTHTRIMSALLDSSKMTAAESLPSDRQILGDIQIPSGHAEGPSTDAINVANAHSDLRHTAAEQVAPDQSFAEQVLAIFCEVTGYPSDCVRLEADLEGELGVDSIKRMEIVGALLEKLQLPAESLEALASRRTLDEMIAAIRGTQSVDPPHSPSAQCNVVEKNTADRESMFRHLQNLVASLTGYPVDMLQDGIDLERDLGIDSIKRVEIIGSLDQLPNLSGRISEKLIDSLAACRTLGEIVDALFTTSHSELFSVPATMEPQVSGVTNLAEYRSGSIQRMIVVPTKIKSRNSMPTLTSKQVLLIVRDQGAFEKAIAVTFESNGYEVTVFDSVEDERERVDSHGEQADARVLSRLSSLKRMDGFSCIVNLMSVNGGAVQPANLQKRVECETQNLATLLSVCKHFETKHKPRFVLSVSRMGGWFGNEMLGADFNPLEGATVGFVKSLSKEWDSSVCRAIDFAVDADPDDVGATLLRELSIAEGPVEIGYREGNTFTLEPQHANAGQRGSEVQLSSSAVILVTGGARGITAEVAKELAKRYRCHFVLLGSSAHITKHASETIDCADSAQSIKAALIEKAKLDGKKIVLKEIEATARSITKTKEIARNLTQIGQHAASVEYRQVDVANDLQLRTAIEDIYARFGAIDGVIHGAGVIEDKLLADKSLESLMRVFSPKSSALATLSQCLRPETMRFFVVFSSISARFGNRGQCDYAAANEAMNKMCLWLQPRWPSVKIKSINWGPWTGVGMVGEQLARQFVASGMQLIGVEAGAREGAEEIQRSDARHIEVLLGGPFGNNTSSREIAEDGLDNEPQSLHFTKAIG